jgi:hypothetical protein
MDELKAPPSQQEIHCDGYGLIHKFGCCTDHQLLYSYILLMVSKSSPSLKRWAEEAMHITNPAAFHQTLDKYECTESESFQCFDKFDEMMATGTVYVSVRCIYLITRYHCSIRRTRLKWNDEIKPKSSSYLNSLVEHWPFGSGLSSIERWNESLIRFNRLSNVIILSATAVA